ncbi:MAG: hypothetical protein ACK5C5_01920 [Bacteroidota bacterium]
MTQSKRNSTLFVLFFSAIFGLWFLISGYTWPVVVAREELKASIEGDYRKLSPVYFGFNAQQIRGPALGDADFVKSIQGLHPNLLRYPGGTVASYWDWKAGWFKDEIPLKKDWREIRKAPIRLEDLKFACDSTKAVPLFVLNMCTSDLPYQMDFLKQARKKGLPVSYVELDNEVYLSETIYTDRFASGEAYAKECNLWIDAIRKEFPNVRIAVVGYSSKESDIRKEKQGLSRALNWNREVLANIVGADAMTFHLYGGNGLSFLKNPGDISGDEDKEPLEYQAIFDRGNGADVILGLPFSRWKNAQAYDLKPLPNGMNAWITEYNMFERDGVVAGTWLHGLYALTQAVTMLQSSKVEISCFHNLSSSAQFGAIFNSTQGFIKSVNQKPTKMHGYSASGYALSTLGRLLDEAESIAMVSFENGTPIIGARGQEYPSVFGVSSKKGSEVRMLVINLSNQPQRINIASVMKSGASWTQYFASPQMQIGTPSDVQRKSLKNGNTAELPPYSTTLITSGLVP